MRRRTSGWGRIRIHPIWGSDFLEGRQSPSGAERNLVQKRYKETCAKIAPRTAPTSSKIRTIGTVASRGGGSRLFTSATTHFAQIVPPARPPAKAPTVV